MLSHREGIQILARQVRPQATRFVLLLLLAAVFAALALAQDAPPPPPPPPPGQSGPVGQPGPPPPSPAAQPPTLAPQQLDPLVGGIALYPDPLLAQILTASTFPEEIPDAANWANEHGALQGQALANAITADNLPWDPSVLALLPFPSVLNMMAQDPAWTQSLGDAVLVQRPT